MDMVVIIHEGKEVLGDVWALPQTFEWDFFPVNPLTMATIRRVGNPNNCIYFVCNWLS